MSDMYLDLAVLFMIQLYVNMKNNVLSLLQYFFMQIDLDLTSLKILHVRSSFLGHKKIPSTCIPRFVPCKLYGDVDAYILKRMQFI